MNSRRSRLVRFAASMLLTAAVTLGAHAFVPSAFGCGSASVGNCREASGATGQTFALIDQVRLVVDLLNVCFP
jgi:hypothetical protein